MDVESNDCAQCGQAAATARCTRCKTVFYCDRECQKAHWKTHKKECGQKATKKQKEEVVEEGEEVVQINRKKKTARAGASSVGPGIASKVRLGMMDQAHPNPTTTPAVPLGGKTRFHTTYSDQIVMVEEYDAQSDELLMRKWQSTSILGAKGKWEFEIGEEATPGGEAGGMFGVSNSNPTFHARDTLEAWEWRVRNVPYPKDVYSITVEEETQELVLRTSNKKFFKRFHIPSMRRHSLLLNMEDVSWEHNSNTLVIQYEKPEQAMATEAKHRADRKKGHSRPF